MVVLLQSLLDRNGECVSLQCLVLPSLVFVPGFTVSVVIPEESRRALLCSSRTSPHIRKQLGLEYRSMNLAEYLKPKLEGKQLQWSLVFFTKIEGQTERECKCKLKTEKQEPLLKGVLKILFTCLLSSEKKRIRLIFCFYIQ